MAKIEQTRNQAVFDLEEFEFKKAVDGIMALADFGNIYFQSLEPWKLIKSDKAAAGAILRSCLQIAKALIIFMEPVMPTKMEAAWRQLGQGGSVSEKPFHEALVLLPEGQSLGKPEILFSRMEDATVKELERVFKDRIAKVESEKPVKIEEKKGQISFEQFSALDLCIGEIKEADYIKGSDKLLRLTVDIGRETRQVVAGIANSYKLDDLVGMQVVVLVNLKPAKLFGIESQAMLLAADVAGKAVLLRPSEKVETGTKVR